jgi:hypothetical protein
LLRPRTGALRQRAFADFENTPQSLRSRLLSFRRCATPAGSLKIKFHAPCNLLTYLGQSMPMNFAPVQHITIGSRINDAHCVPAVSTRSLEMLEKFAANLKKGLVSAPVDRSAFIGTKRPGKAKPKRKPEQGSA